MRIMPQEACGVVRGASSSTWCWCGPRIAADNTDCCSYNSTTVLLMNDDPVFAFLAAKSNIYLACVVCVCMHTPKNSSTTHSCY